jgi:hypothetical protein
MARMAKGSGSDKKGTGASTAALKPKPPEVLQNIAWLRANWRKHKLVIAIAIVVVAVNSLAITTP